MLLLRLIVKNAFRHRLRSMLTILGVTIALMAFGLMRTVLDAWHAGVSASSANRLVTRNAVSLVQPLPYAYKGRIRQVSGVSGFNVAVNGPGIPDSYFSAGQIVKLDGSRRFISWNAARSM